MSNRKRFVIINNHTSNDKPIVLAVRNSVVTETGFGKHTWPFTKEEQAELYERYGFLDGDSGYFARRKYARLALAKIRKDTDFGHTYHDYLRIVELGEFHRTVRPVKHWNIVRNWCRVDDGKRGPWLGESTWLTGIPRRADARAQAQELAKQWADPEINDGREFFKFTAVPVYVLV